MNISCNVIRDILPLYAEDMVCDETKALVDEHLCGCDACTKELGKLKKKEVIPVSVDTAPMEHIRKAIWKRQILTTVCVILTILSLMWTGTVYMTAPIYLPAEKAIEGVELREDGGLAIDYADGVSAMSSYYGADKDICIIAVTTRGYLRNGVKTEKKLQAMTPEEREDYYKSYATHTGELTQADYDKYQNVIVYSTFQNENDSSLIDQRSAFNGVREEDGTWTRTELDYDFWYMGMDGKPEKLLWQGGDGEFSEQTMCSLVEPDRLAQWVFLGCLAAAALAFYTAWFLRKSKWGKVPMGIGIGCVSASLHILLATSGDFVDIAGMRPDVWGDCLMLTTALLTGTTLLWLYRHDMNKKGSF